MAGLSADLAPPPKRPVRPLKPPLMPPSGLPFGALVPLGVAGLSPDLSPPPPKRPASPPKTPGFLSLELLELEGEELLPAGRLPEPKELPELLEPLLLDPLPNDELPLGEAGRFALDELPKLPELLEPEGEELLLGGRLPPNGDDPLGLLELPLPELPKLDPLVGGRLPLPKLLDPEGDGLLLGGRLPPNGDVPPVDVVGLLGDVGRLPLDEPNGGRAADEAELLDTGLVRPPAPGRFEVGRLLEPPNGFTRDDDDELLSSSSF
ncbi:MAG: hypothetical protein GC179_11475 [Anaerolineaceae bacterium]|nr:hypothetical protein [Anaerolineaceae bacterium]